jgi:hypothetical protein
MCWPVFLNLSIYWKMKRRLTSTIPIHPMWKTNETTDIEGSLTGVGKESSFLNIKSIDKYLTVYVSTGRNISEDINRQREVSIAFKWSRKSNCFILSAHICIIINLKLVCLLNVLFKYYF